MKNYSSYMDRQEISPEVHEKLLNLEVPKRAGRPWVRYGTLAACAALIVGVGVWKLAPASVQSGGQFAAGYDPLPGETDVVGPDDLFVVNSPVEEGNYSFFAMPAVAYPDRTGSLEVAADIALPKGAFMVDLEKEDIQKLFWGPEGIPDTYQTEIGRQDLPWALFWDGYTVHGYAWYDGQGELFQAHIFGEKGRAGFQLTLRPGSLPLTCLVELGQKISDAFGVEVTGWSTVYDRDGDDQIDCTCTSQFMAGTDVGVRFESWNNGKAEDGIDGEAWFNTLFIRQALSDGLHLDHLLTAGHIPAWRDEVFDSLAQARQETDFAPYLPTEGPEGYGEFLGHLSYQEGRSNSLLVSWSQGYDNVIVTVYRDGCRSYNLVDPAKPETYDLRLYPIPWCDSVPEAYRETVDRPAFRAEDMSLEIVEARWNEHDTGGRSYSFDVLHPDGTLVSCRCDGMTAEAVWALVESTL